MTGGAHALLVLRVFFYVQLCTFSEISWVNAQSKHVSRCPHTQDMPPGIWGQVTQGWAVKSTQAGRWRADCEVRIRLLGTLMATASIMAFIVWRLSHRASTVPFIYNNPFCGWVREWAAFIIRVLSSQLPALLLLIFVFPRSVLSSNFFFHLYNLVIFIANNYKGCCGHRVIEDVWGTV